MNVNIFTTVFRAIFLVQVQTQVWDKSVFYFQGTHRTWTFSLPMAGVKLKRDELSIKSDWTNSNLRLHKPSYFIVKKHAKPLY